MVTEVVTMKMISRTRKISVSGVILMSAKTPPPSPPCGPLIATRLPPLECSVDQPVVVDVLDSADVLNLDREVVVENNRDDRDRESERSRNQRFRNTGRDDRETAGAHDCHGLERDQNTDHRAEQPDERGRRARGREYPDVTLELEAFLVASLVVELEQMIAVTRLGARNQRVKETFGSRPTRLGGLQSLLFYFSAAAGGVRGGTERGWVRAP